MSENGTPSQSYFWSCLTLSYDCPFISTRDSKLFYFGVTVFVLYCAFLLAFLADLNFFWPLEKLQDEVGYCINLVSRKVRKVQMDQNRMVPTQEKIEKQLKRSQQCQRIVTAFRGALRGDDWSGFQDDSARQATWSECHSVKTILQ